VNYVLFQSTVNKQHNDPKARLTCNRPGAAPFFVSLGVAVATKTPVKTAVVVAEPLVEEGGADVAAMDAGIVPG